MLNVAAERAKGEEKLARAPEGAGRRRGATKPCPISPSCPAVIPARWLMCHDHWGMVPAPDKLVNRRFCRKYEHALVTVAAGQALFTLWTMLELAWVNRPPDENHRGWRGWDAGAGRRAEDHPLYGRPELCLCTWCGPLWRRVLFTLELSPDYWLMLLKQRGHGDLPASAAGWEHTQALGLAALHRRRREAAEACRGSSPPAGGDEGSGAHAGLGECLQAGA